MKKNFEVIALLSLVLSSVFLKLLQLSNHIADKIQLTNTLDFSWSIDITERLLHGYLAGRDFIFTYGPLYQYINSIPAILFDLPSYSSIQIAQLLLALLNCLFIIFITKQFFTNKKDQLLITAGLLCFITIGIFPDPNNTTRILLPLVYTVIYTKVLKIFFERPASWRGVEKLKKYLAFFSALALPAIFGLYTYDLFVICIIITLVIFSYDLFIAFKKNKKKNITAFLGANKNIIFLGTLQIIIIFSWELITSILLSGNLNYLFYSLDTVRSYQYIMNIPFSLTNNILLVIFPLFTIILFMYVMRTKINHDHKKILTLLLIASLLQMKAAFIRADDGHLLIGVYPSILMFVIFLYIILKEKFRFWKILFFLIIALLIPNKDYSWLSYSVTNLHHVFSIKEKTFFDIYQFPDNYYYTKEDFHFFDTFIPQNIENIMIFPYDTYLLNIYGNTYNTLPLQFYDYSNSLVEKDAVAKLDQSPPQYIIFGIDKKGALNLDNIPNVSRNPLIAKWMMSNYSVYKNKGNYLVLKYDPKKKAVSDNECTIYDIDTTNVIDKNVFENILKPSTYYLDNDRGIRLPNTANTTEVFLVEKFDDAKKLEKLFNKKINFSKSYEEKRKMKILRKFPIPKLEKEYNQLVTLNCY